MEYGKIIAVTGLPGLFELMSSKNDGAIVRSLEDNNTRFVSSRIHNFSHLESIEVFTVRDNVNLADVFHAMEKSSESLPSEKDNNQLKGYFEKVYPDLDFSRVYTSDLKKMVKWFNALKSNQVEIRVRQAGELAEEAPVEEPAEVTAPAEEPKPKKAAAKKKAEPSEEAAAEKPVKKAAPKKKKSEE